MRLTARGRVVVTLLLVGMLAGVAWLLSAAVSAAPVRPASSVSVVVEPGDSLWSIARRVAPQADPRVTTARIVAANHLGDAPIVPGQQLLVPAAG